MSVRLRYKIGTAISSTTAEEKDLANFYTEVVNDLQNDGVSMKIVLAASTTNYQVTFPTFSSGNYLMIRTTTVDPTQTAVNISLNINSTGNTPIVIAPMGTVEGAFMMTTTGLTSIYLTNATSTNMQVTIQAAGT